MKIKSVNTYILDIPTIRPHQLAMTTITVQSIVVAQVIDTEGLEGWAEVATIGGASYGEGTPEAIKVNIDKYITPHLIGQYPKMFNRVMNDVKKLVRGNHFAKAVVEGAMIDLAARQKGVPAYELLGGKIHDSLPLAWTLASGDTDRDIEEAKEMLHLKRHKIFKLKIGTGDPWKNVEHVLKIIDAVGDQARITVDVNQAWDEDTAVYCIEALEDGGVSMIEQPLPTWNYEGMSRLTKRFKVPILSDESSTSLQDTYRIIKNRSGNSLALKPAKHGGLLETQKVAAVAEGAGFGLYGGTMIETTLGNAVCASVYSTIPKFEFGVELFGPFLFKDKFTAEDIKWANYELIIPNGPGFGVEVDKEKVKFYAR